MNVRITSERGGGGGRDRQGQGDRERERQPAREVVEVFCIIV